jgi:hypothetical protein
MFTRQPAEFDAAPPGSYLHFYGDFFSIRLDALSLLSRPSLSRRRHLFRISKARPANLSGGPFLFLPAQDAF